MVCGIQLFLRMNKLMNTIPKSAHFRAEVKKLRLIFYLKSTILCMGTLCTKTSFCISMLTYLYIEETVTAEKVFTAMTCYASISDALTICIPVGIAYMAEGRASIDRINEILCKPEMEEQLPENINEDKITRITLHNVNVVLNSKKVLFDNLSGNIDRELVALTGPIGSGKSTLLKTILKEIDLVSGDVQVSLGIILFTSMCLQRGR